jgi:hypothetical protein
MERENQARQNILNGIYPSRVIQGRQNKHIESTTEYKQKQVQIEKASSGSRPSKVNPDVDIQALVDKHKGTGHIDFANKAEYPFETIVADYVIGQTWVISKQIFVDTRVFKIFYSSTGVHIVPVNEKGRV